MHINVNTFKFEDIYKFNITQIKELMQKPKIKKMWCPIVIGVKSGGKIVVVDIQEIPHILVAGIPRSGKSSWIIQLLYGISVLRPDVIIFYIDFKGADAWKIEPIGFSTVEPKEVYQFLSAIEKEADNRQMFIRQNKASMIHGFNNIPPIIVAIDEITDMTDDECQKIFQRLGRKGRNVGIHLIAGTQKPSHKTFKDFCESRSLFEGKMAFRLAEAKDSQLVIGSNKAYSLIDANSSGRAIWHWGGDEIVQSLYISDKDLISNIIEDRVITNNLGLSKVNYNFNQIGNGVNLLDKPKQNIWLL